MLPLWITSGILWPLEAMHPYIQNIVLLGPLTRTVEALRFIMLRSWSYSKTQVLYGYITSLVYAAILNILNILLLNNNISDIYSAIISLDVSHSK